MQERNVAKMPLKPKESFENFRNIDKDLSTLVGGLWGLVWGNPESAIEPKIKLLLSLSNAVGARRLRQAARELIKAYAAGCTVKEMDELFSLFVWNQGVGNFASEIGPSVLFAAYQLIKREESINTPKERIVEKLKENFGEGNSSVSVSAKVKEN